MIATGAALHLALADFALRAAGRWSARGKAIPAALAAMDPALATRFTAAFAALFTTWDALLQVVDPDTAISLIRNFADAVPITHLYSWTLPPGLPPRWAQTHLELFASKVIPAFR